MGIGYKTGKKWPRCKECGAKPDGKGFCGRCGTWASEQARGDAEGKPSKK